MATAKHRDNKLAIVRPSCRFFKSDYADEGRQTLIKAIVRRWISSSIISNIRSDASMLHSLDELAQRVLEKTGAYILTLDYALALVCLPLGIPVRFLWSQAFLLSPAIFANPLGFTPLLVSFLLGLQIQAKLLNQGWSLRVLSSGSMQFEIDMTVVIIELFLADLAEIGVRGCLQDIFLRLEAICGASILEAALNFFFELAFLEVAILLEVFLS